MKWKGGEGLVIHLLCHSLIDRDLINSPFIQAKHEHIFPFLLFYLHLENTTIFLIGVSDLIPRRATIITGENCEWLGVGGF